MPEVGAAKPLDHRGPPPSASHAPGDRERDGLPPAETADLVGLGREAAGIAVGVAGEQSPARGGVQPAD
jgi:hypothetical protein